MGKNMSQDNSDKSQATIIVAMLGMLGVICVAIIGLALPFAQEGKDQVVSDPLAFVNDPSAILVSKKLAQERGLRVGSPLSLVTSEGNKEFFVMGLLEDAGPAASFGGQVVVMFIDAAQVSFSRGYSSWYSFG